MNKLLLPLLLLWGPTALVAQFSLNAFTSTGPAWFEDEVGDTRGTGLGLGLGVEYAINPTWGSVGLEIAREDFTGFNISRNFAQLVPTLDPMAEPEAVSLQTSYRNLRAYRLSLTGRGSFRRGQSRFGIGWGISLLRISTDRGVRSTVVKQSLDGEIINNSFRDFFQVENGAIRRIPQAEVPDRYDNQLNRYRAQLSLTGFYELASDVRLFITSDTVLGAVGQDYGERGTQNMLGSLSGFRVGLSGTLFSW